MLSAENIALCLLRNGFNRPPQSGLKVQRFEHPRLSKPVFLKQSNSSRETTPLILHPCYEIFEASLLSHKGVKQSETYLHNSNLQGYPKRFNRGKREIEYGIELGFEDTETLTCFLNELVNISRPDANKYNNIFDPSCGSGGLLIHAPKILDATYSPSSSPLSVAIQKSHQSFGTSPAVRDDVALTDTERRALIKVRIGQGTYRTQLFSLWGGCAVTGCSSLTMLRASHAKPWSVSTPAERLDPFNGLLLVPNLDQAFDEGLVSFSDSGVIMISSTLDELSAKLLGITTGLSLRYTPSALLPYLKWHRDNLFRM
jgi:hypothetical protein